ncbi:MAG: hypothetical protein KBF73_10660 [Flavobacteriales bacterium]|nr:hypothetical protein [Flavobacteriales bacterium]
MRKINAGRPHRIIDFVSLMVVSIFVISGLSSCEETCYDGKKNQNEEQEDCGGPCVPCDTTNGTCFDGLQNQGETGIDCGGPCNACITDSTILDPDFICTGTGSSSYFPLSVNSYWIYRMPASQWFQLEITEETQLGNGEFYSHMITTGAFGTIHDYYREESGQTFKWNNALSAEEVYLPANPTVGMQWTTAGTDSIVIESTSASLSSQNGCSYSNLLQVVSYAGGTGSSAYYMRGLGLVQLTSASAYLDSVVVY